MSPVTARGAAGCLKAALAAGLAADVNPGGAASADLDPGVAARVCRVNPGGSDGVLCEGRLGVL